MLGAVGCRASPPSSPPTQQLHPGGPAASAPRRAARRLPALDPLPYALQQCGDALDAFEEVTPRADLLRLDLTQPPPPPPPPSSSDSSSTPSPAASPAAAVAGEGSTGPEAAGPAGKAGTAATGAGLLTGEAVLSWLDASTATAAGSEGPHGGQAGGVRAAAPRMLHAIVVWVDCGRAHDAGPSPASRGLDLERHAVLLLHEPVPVLAAAAGGGGEAVRVRAELHGEGVNVSVWMGPP